MYYTGLGTQLYPECYIYCEYRHCTCLFCLYLSIFCIYFVQFINIHSPCWLIGLDVYALKFVVLHLHLMPSTIICFICYIVCIYIYIYVCISGLYPRPSSRTTAQWSFANYWILPDFVPSGLVEEAQGGGLPGFFKSSACNYKEESYQVITLGAADIEAKIKPQIMWKYWVLREGSKRIWILHRSKWFTNCILCKFQV